VRVVLILALAAIVVTVRVLLRRRRRTTSQAKLRSWSRPVTSEVALVAAREIRERIRGKIFRFGTLLILAVVAAAIVIPTLKTKTTTTEGVGIVGALPASARATVVALAKSAPICARDTLPWPSSMAGNWS